MRVRVTVADARAVAHGPTRRQPAVPAMANAATTSTAARDAGDAASHSSTASRAGSVDAVSDAVAPASTEPPPAPLPQRIAAFRATAAAAASAGADASAACNVSLPPQHAYTVLGDAGTPLSTTSIDDVLGALAKLAGQTDAPAAWVDICAPTRGDADFLQSVRRAACALAHLRPRCRPA